MRHSNPGIEQTQGLQREPIAVLKCGQEETLSGSQASAPVEQTNRTVYGTVSYFQFGKVSYSVFKLRGVEGEHVILCGGDVDTMQLAYLVEGTCKYQVNGGETRALCAGDHHRVFSPKGSVMLVEFTVPDEIMLVVVGIESRHFQSYLPSPYAENLLSLAIMPDQFAILFNIIDCKCEPFIRHHYVKAKIDELLVLHLEQSVLHTVKSQAHDLREEELQRVYKVRDMLYWQPSKSYSLVGLAHAVGTNDSTLKKHFKQAFGTTVFSYLTACRMELAKSLLLKNNQKVAVVAQEVGYKYASHFSTAFRKYYGYLPTKLLRSVISLPVGFLFW